VNQRLVAHGAVQIMVCPNVLDAVFDKGSEVAVAAWNAGGFTNPGLIHREISRLCRETHKV
jgi:hypothetical protein